MSSGAGSVSRFDRVREIPLYDQVPVGSLMREPDFPPPPASLNETVPAVSYDPLPPPPLPDQPAVGPASFQPPSDDEPMDEDRDAMDIKPVHRFIPDSVKNFFRGNSDNRGSNGWPTAPNAPPLPDSHSPAPSSEKSAKCHTTSGVPCSPPNSAPPSPSVPGSYRDPYVGSGGSYISEKERDRLLLGAEALDSASAVPTSLSALTYEERVEEYHQRYAYLKSWPGLLRILGCVQLLLGAAVFACVCAYVHKDNEWFNMYGYSQPQLYGGLGGGASAYGYGGGQYTGPKTAFVLVVAGLAWIVTVILVVLGMSIYYRAILLDSSWWPLTECSINLVLAVLYLAAGIVYVRDTTRGGLCSLPVFNAGVNIAFCRTEAGQTAALIFIFITMVLYFISAGVCLKLWRHEASRLRKEALAHEMRTIGSTLPLSLLGGDSNSSGQTPLPTIQPDIMDSVNNPAAASLMKLEPEILRGHIPAGHIPKPVVIADYVAKYPSILSDEGRDQYKAVFNDQYAEYKELHSEVQAMAKKFEAMDEMMQNLPSGSSSQMENERINGILFEYRKKKSDPTFLEKRERCEYLKNKLSHIKQKIQEYNKVELQSHFSMAHKKRSSPAHHSSGSKHHSSRNRHSELMSNPAFSYYPGDQMLHFYTWKSPPGVMKIMCIIIIIMCVAVFACVASTLAWDYDASLLGGGAGFLPGFGGGGGQFPVSGGGIGGGIGGGSFGGGFGSGGIGGSSNYAYGGQQVDPKTGKGFIIAISGITFIAVLIIFVLVISRQSTARSAKFYLATIIICAILAFLMLIASIVYLVAVNPTAQSTGSVVYNQIRQLCAQYQNQNQAQGLFINQYLYHYCVVEPQEAIAIVLGFLVIVGLIILLVFAARTRSRIRRWGEDRVLWEEVKVVRDGLHSNGVGEWVKNVSGEPEVMLNDPNPYVGGPRDFLDHNTPVYLPGDSDISSSLGGLKAKMKDYDPGVESGDDLEEEDFSVMFPSIVDEQERLNYKREFERDHQEYKSLQADLDSLNRDLADLDRALDRHPAGSPQFLDAMDEYTKLKNLKKSPNYEIKKKRCKYLRSKLSHIKKMISDYDRRP
ncbi:MARVEL domain-containing protein 2-like [Brachionichthys hirsutus]|uniref:MARVEL domain-containing protein 2-like n=1 Tax=Brachionichthys hirsutus TaxID=412623 RepID=UPI00360479FC